MTSERLSRQLEFLVEIDRLKQVLRRTVTVGTDRNENSAEHSWHIALMAIVLAEYSAEKNLDMGRAIKMMLVHDLVEIDAGDTYCYDAEAGRDKRERETAAADRIFALLPPDQARELRGLWDEFEAARTGEARFANSLDRLQALVLNYEARGSVWRKYGVKSGQVLKRAAPIADGAPALWEYAEALVADSVRLGLLEK